MFVLLSNDEKRVRGDELNQSNHWITLIGTASLIMMMMMIGSFFGYSNIKAKLNIRVPFRNLQ